MKTTQQNHQESSLQGSKTHALSIKYKIKTIKIT